MANLEKVGIGAVVTADTKQYVDSMGRARDANRRFVKGAGAVPPPLGKIGLTATRVTAKMRAMTQGVARGARMMGSGLRDMGLGLAPLSLGLGAAVSQAAGFEKQMSAVGAVSRASETDMASLSKEARRMGIVSVFSASQAAEGMENMARAGAKPHQIIAGLSGVMDAAAADGITLAQSSDIVARVVKGMGKEWEEAGHIANNLALASASTNTNILALGESFVYGVATSKSMGISLEETTAIFGKLADAGLRGSMGGTAYTNMMTKLAKPTGKASKIMKKWGIVLEEDNGKLKKIGDIVDQFKEKLSGIKSVTQQQAIAQEIFGKRGARAYTALANAGGAEIEKLREALVNSSKDGGAAMEMAKRRLDNFAGSVTLLKSSLEGLSIGLFQPMLKPFATSIRQFTEGFNKVLMALNDINDFWKENPDATEFPTKSLEKYGDTVAQIALGLRDAVDAIGDAWEWVTDKVKAASQWFEKTFGGTSMRSIIKVVTLIAMAGAALAPLILGLAMAKFVIGGLVSVISGAASVIAAIFWPVVIAIGAAILAYQLLKKENESFFQTAARVWGEIKVWALDVWENALKPMWYGIKGALIPAVEEWGVLWGEIVGEIKTIFREVYVEIFGGNEKTKISWLEVGKVIGAVIGAIGTTILFFVRYIIPLIAGIVKVVYWVVKQWAKFWNAAITQTAEWFASFAVAFQDMFAGDILKGLARIGTGILDLVLKPLRLIIEGALALGDALSIDVPDALRTFAEEGLTGLAFDIPAKGTEKVFKTRGEMLASLGVVKTEELVKPGDGPSDRFAEYDPLKDSVDAKKLQREAMIDQMRRDIVNRREAAGASLGPTSIAKELADMVAKKDAAAAAPSEVVVENKLEDKRTVEVNTRTCLDGEDINMSSSKHRIELQERAGFKNTPWQKRAILEHGAAPVTRG